MRPIDADAIPESATAISTDGRLFVAWSEIVKAPILDYKNLVPQGEWEFVKADENDMPIYRCTNCKTKRYGRPNFCSNCGANMRKRRESE